MRDEGLPRRAVLAAEEFSCELVGRLDTSDVVRSPPHVEQLIQQLEVGLREVTHGDVTVIQLGSCARRSGWARVSHAR